MIFAVLLEVYDGDIYLCCDRYMMGIFTCDVRGT